MDTKIEIKEDNIVSQDDREFFTMNVTMKTDRDAVPLDNVAVKMEIKSETPFQHIYSEKERECFTEHFIKQIKSETFTYNNNCEIDTKIKIDPQSNREFLAEDPVMKIKKHNIDHEMDNTIEIKEEPWWLEAETSSVYNDFKDGDSTPVKSARLCTEAFSGDNSGESVLPSAEASGKNTSFRHAKACLQCESDITKMSSVEKCVHSEQCSQYGDGGEICTTTLLIHKGKRSHKCDICDKSFSLLSSLKMHNLIHEGKKLHKCDICEKSFPRSSYLKRHKLIHEDKKLHKCEVCEKRFTQLCSLKRHNFIHGGNKPHKCEICDKSFTHLSSLKMHNLIHEGKKPHKCEICGKRFTQLPHLKLHNLIHEGKKPHKCDICNKSFTHLSYMRTHNLIHEGKKPHECEICGKRFTRLSYLKMHNLIHEGKKPYKCKICDKSFTHLPSLKTHNLIHEGKKPHKCEICEKRFTQLSHLKRHNLIH